MLKIRTKEVLYERYRTEKLLTRRATKSISADQHRQMFDGELQQHYVVTPSGNLSHLQNSASNSLALSPQLSLLFLIVMDGYICCHLP